MSKLILNRKQEVALSVALSSGSLIAVCNPIAVYFLLGPGKYVLLYCSLANVLLLAVLIAAVRFLTSKGGFPTFAFALSALLPLLFVLEIGLAWIRLTYVVQASPEQGPDTIWRPSDRFGWDLTPNTRPNHIVEGNFDVHYGIDGQGRRVTPRRDDGERTLAPHLGRRLRSGSGFQLDGLLPVHRGPDRKYSQHPEDESRASLAHANLPGSHRYY